MKQLLSFTLLTAFVGLLCLSPLTAQNTWAHFRNVGRVTSVAQTPSHFWLATEHGVVRVQRDNLNKDWYTPFNSNLPSEHIQQMRLSPAGDPWIGTYDVIMSKWNGSDWETQAMPEDIALAMKGKVLYDFDFAPNGDLWIGTDNGLIRRDAAGNWTYWTSNELESLVPGTFLDKIWAIGVDDSNNVFIGASSFVRFSDGVFTDLTGDNFQNDLFSYSDCNLAIYENRAYVVTDIGHVGILEAGQVIVQSTLTALGADGQISNTSHLVTPHALPLVYGDYTGVWAWENNTINSYSTPLIEKMEGRVQAYWTDDAGQSWATRYDHLYWLDNGMLDSVQLSNELNGVRVGSVAQIAEDKLLFTINSPLYYESLDANIFDYSNKTWSKLTLPGSTASAKFLRTDFEGRIWLAADNDLYHFDNNEWVNISELTNAPSDISAFYTYSTYGEHIWTANSYKIYHYDGSTWTTFSSTNSALFTNGYIPSIVALANGEALFMQYDYYSATGTDEYYIRHIHADQSITSEAFLGLTGLYILNTMKMAPDGKIWGTSFNGMAVRNVDGTWETLTNGMLTDYVFDIQFTDADNLLLASENNGLIFYNHSTGEMSNFSPDNSALSDSTVHFSYKDTHGTIWCFNNVLGVDAYNPDGFATEPNNTHETAAVSVKAWPNPATSHIDVMWTSAGAQTETLEVLDATGRTMILEVAKNPGHTLLNVTQLPTGIYTILVNTAQNTFSTRFIKQ